MTTSALRLRNFTAQSRLGKLLEPETTIVWHEATKGCKTEILGRSGGQHH